MKRSGRTNVTSWRSRSGRAKVTAVDQGKLFGRSRSIHEGVVEMQNEQKPVQTLKAHLALNVKDVEVSLEFYRKLLDIEPSKVRTGYAKFDVQNPPLNLTLNQHVFNE